MSRLPGSGPAAMVVALAGWVWSGCSWVFVKPLPPDYEPGDPAVCTTSVAAPVADTLLAASNLAGFFYLAGKAGDQPTPAQNAVASAAVGTLVYAFAAGHGYAVTATCRAAVADELRTGRGFPMPRSGQGTNP